MTLFPGDFGVKNVGKDGCGSVGNKAIQPKEFIGVHNDTSKKSIDKEVKKRKNDAYQSEFADADGSFLRHILYYSISE